MILVLLRTLKLSLSTGTAMRMQIFLMAFFAATQLKIPLLIKILSKYIRGVFEHFLSL